MSMLDLPLSLEDRAEAVFGDNADTMDDLEARAWDLLPSDAIVWECDATTFAFSYVSPSAEAVLGYPTRSWIEDTTFWATRVVHENDAEEAVNFCATETACDRDHAFEYRARAADGRIVRLRDVVRVVPPMNGHPKRLRGVMFVVG
jgi:PAS domain-containing protein